MTLKAKTSDDKSFKKFSLQHDKDEKVFKSKTRSILRRGSGCGDEELLINLGTYSFVPEGIGKFQNSRRTYD